MQTTLARLTTAFRDTFDDDLLELTRDGRRRHRGLGFVLHVTLMVNLEKAFGVKFTSAQVALLADVGELVALIESVTGGRAETGATLTGARTPGARPKQGAGESRLGRACASRTIGTDLVCVRGTRPKKAALR